MGAKIAHDKEILLSVSNSIRPELLSKIRDTRKQVLSLEVIKVKISDNLNFV